MNHAFSIIPLTIETRGEIITNNLSEFRELVREALGNINRELQTDEQFGQAELDVKALKSAEESVREAALKSFDDQLKALVDGLNSTAEEIRAPRLELEKLIAKRKDEVKSEIIEEFLAAFDIQPEAARKHFLKGLQESIKGKRTLESMRAACRVYQTTQQACIIKSRATIERFVAKFGPDMVMDRRELELKGPDSVEAELLRRYEAKKAADEAAKLRAEADAAKAEAAKAKQEVEAVKAAPAAEAVEQAPWDTEAKPPAPVKTEHEEWLEFKAASIAAFQAIKAKRELLTYSKNIAKAQGIANGFNSTWKEWA